MNTFLFILLALSCLSAGIASPKDNDARRNLRRCYKNFYESLPFKTPKPSHDRAKLLLPHEKYCFLCMTPTGALYNKTDVVADLTLFDSVDCEQYNITRHSDSPSSDASPVEQRQVSADDPMSMKCIQKCILTLNCYGYYIGSSNKNNTREISPVNRNKTNNIGHFLVQNQNFYTNFRLVSQNGKFSAQFMPSGDFVVYNNTSNHNNIIYTIQNKIKNKSSVREIFYLTLHSNGSLVLYNNFEQVQWFTAFSKNNNIIKPDQFSNKRLVLFDNGDMGICYHSISLVAKHLKLQEICFYFTINNKKHYKNKIYIMKPH